LFCKRQAAACPRGNTIPVSDAVNQRSHNLTLVLVGATGTGKSDVAFHLAKEYLPGEIVSADSRLVYRHMDIATAKPSPEMIADVPHHMIDIVDPDARYTCKEFQTDARGVIHDILQRGLTPIVVGGSGLYVRALTDGVFDGPAANDEVRESLTREAETRGSRHLWGKLREVDPEKAAKIDPENAVRIIRALEVYEITGERMSDLEKNTEPLDVPFAKIGLRRQTGDLYRRIGMRVDLMMEKGLLGETGALMDAGYGGCRAVRNTLGYRELLNHLEGKTALADAVDLIKLHTRRFAKRQGTWFNREKDIRWIDIKPDTRIAAIAQIVYHRYKQAL
jgi:tRNA dimethylallyltransferase